MVELLPCQISRPLQWSVARCRVLGPERVQVSGPRDKRVAVGPRTVPGDNSAEIYGRRCELEWALGR